MLSHACEQALLWGAIILLPFNTSLPPSCSLRWEQAAFQFGMLLSLYLKCRLCWWSIILPTRWQKTKIKLCGQNSMEREQGRCNPEAVMFAGGLWGTSWPTVGGTSELCQGCIKQWCSERVWDVRPPRVQRGKAGFMSAYYFEWLWHEKVKLAIKRHAKNMPAIPLSTSVWSS